MAQQKKIGGTLYLKVNGDSLKAKGAFTFNAGYDKQEEVMGSGGFQGVKSVPQPAFIDGTITVDPGTDLEPILTEENATVSLELASGDTFVLSDAIFAGEGTISSEEGELSVRWVADKGRLVPGA